MAKVKTLAITDERGFILLTPHQMHLYGCRSDNCDGNAHFPRAVVENADVVAAGYGHYHTVIYYDNRDWLYLAIMLGVKTENIKYDDLREALVAAETNGLYWSGYDCGNVIVIENIQQYRRGVT